MRGSWIVPALLVGLSGCEHLGRSAGISYHRDPIEVASRLVELQLETANLRSFAMALRGKSFKDDSFAALSTHLDRAADLVLSNEGLPDQERLIAAIVGLDAGGLNYDLIRYDVEASARGLSGASRSNANRGVEQTNIVMLGMSEDWRWALNHRHEAEAAILKARIHRDNLEESLPVANVMRAGVAAANIQSAAISLDALAKSGLPALHRLLAWMRGAGAPGAGLQLAGIGGSLSIRAVIGTQALVLTGAEIVALVQLGQVSGTVVGLLYLARGNLHHICTDKNWISTTTGGPWSPRFQDLFEGAGIGFNHPDNLVELAGHFGPHPEAYHRIVFQRLQAATKGLDQGTPGYREAVLSTLRALGKEIRTPGTELNRLITGAAQ